MTLSLNVLFVASEAVPLAKTVFTVHNPASQGNFQICVAPQIGVPMAETRVTGQCIVWPSKWQRIRFEPEHLFAIWCAHPALPSEEHPS